jgi:hemerythrin-like domain-containing protein
MEPLIDSLLAEHRDLRSALGILRALSRHVAAGGRFPGGDCAIVLRYLRDFLIGVHFVKEARTLLPSLAVFGRPRDVQAAGDAFRAQGQATDLVHALVLFWEPTDTLTGAERRGFVSAAGHLGRILDRSMRHEEQRLFPALASIPADDRLGWRERTAAIEVGRRPAAEWRTEFAELASRWS